MAIWKRKRTSKKEAEEEVVQAEQLAEGDVVGNSPVEITETQPIHGQSGREEPVSGRPPEAERQEVIQNEATGGVIVRGKKISGFFSKSFWGILSILILPPLFVFAFGVLIVAFMLIFPLLAIMLAASMPVVFVTLSIFLVVLPVIFPLLVLFLLITGKGRLLIGSEGRWLGLEMFGKTYSLR